MSKTNTDYTQVPSIDLVPGGRKAVTSSAKRGDFPMFEIDELHVIPGFNVRLPGPDLDAHVRGLADLMKQVGFKSDKPLTGFVAKKNGEDIVQITDGHCRLAAAKLAISEGAPIERIPVILLPNGTNIEDITASLVSSNSGRSLTRLEYGIVCKRLESYGWDEDEIVSRTGLSKVSIQDSLMLLGSPRGIRDLIQQGRVSETFALDTIKKYGEHAEEHLRATVENADRAGSKKAMPKHAPDAAYKKVVKKATPMIVETIRSVRSDPEYTRISAELREKIDELVRQLDEAQSAAAGTSDEAGGE